MATGGWGAYNNPFPQGQATDDVEEQPVGYKGAWPAGGSNTFETESKRTGGPRPAPSAPTAATAAVSKSASGGFFGRKAKPDEQLPASFGGDTRAAGDRGNGAIDAREADLQRREVALMQAQSKLKESVKNWPACYPILRHNIGEDVPAWNRSMVRFAYLNWLVEFTAFSWNWLVILMMFIANARAGMIKWWFLATLTWVMGVPLSFFLWYRGVYFGAKTDGATFTYIKTFIWIILDMAWCAWMIVAIPDVGDFSAGVFPMMDLFGVGDSKSTIFGIFCVVNIVLWGIVAFCDFILLGRCIAAMRAGDVPRKQYELKYGVTAPAS